MNSDYEEEDGDDERNKELDRFLKNTSHTDQPLREQIMIVVIFMAIIYVIVTWYDHRTTYNGFDGAMLHGNGIATPVQSAPYSGPDKVKW